MQVFLVLAERPGEIRSKERIIEEVWRDTFVTDGVLWNAVSELRRVFRDAPSKSSCIQTVPRKGYRLTAPVSVVHESEDIGRISSLGVSRLRDLMPALSVAVAAIVIGFFGFLYWTEGSFPIGRPASIAVLPFHSSDRIQDGSYVSEAVSAGLSSILFHASHLKVAPSSALHRYSGVKIDPLEVGADLGVDAVVFGLLSGEDDRYTLDLELLDVRSGDLLWAEQYRGDFGTLSFAQGQAARSILSHTTGKLDQETLSLLTHPLPHDQGAQSAYLKGRYYYNEFLFRNPKFGLRKSAELLQRTIALEPDFSPAYHWLSKTYYHLGRTLQDEGYFLKARQWAERSIMAREPSAEAYQWMGEILWTYDRDWEGADRDFTIAHELNPHLGPTIPFLLTTGRRESALRQIQIEYGMADPWSVTDAIGHGWWYFFAGDFDHAIELAKKGLELEPDLPMAGRLLAACYERQGRFQEAVRTEVAALKRKATEYGGQPGLNDIEARAVLEAFRRGGIRAYWSALLARALPVGNPIAISSLYGRLCDKEHALEWLVKAYEMKEMGLVATPWFDCLRQDPAYERRLVELRFLPPPAVGAVTATLVANTPTQP